ncbi:MAG: DUF3280 domain-containing protein [Nitrososphaeraceae archaeon]
MNSPATIVRVLGLVIAPMLLAGSPAASEPLRAAVFDFELLDTSLQGAVNGPQPEEQRRLNEVTELLRKGLAVGGKFVVLDIASVNAAAHASNLQACGGCDVQYAQKLGADLSITGLVQKVSALILNMNIYLKDAHTGQLITVMSADFRSNTDESWSRTMSYLLRNRLLAPNFGATQ